MTHAVHARELAEQRARGQAGTDLAHRDAGAQQIRAPDHTMRATRDPADRPVLVSHYDT